MQTLIDKRTAELLRYRSELARLTDAAESLCTFLLAHHLTAAGSDACVELLGRIAAAQEVLDSD